MHWYPNSNSFFMFIRLNESRKSTTPRVAFKIQMNPSNLRAFWELSDHRCKTKIRTIHYSTKSIHSTYEQVNLLYLIRSLSQSFMNDIFMKWFNLRLKITLIWRRFSRFSGTGTYNTKQRIKRGFKEEDRKPSSTLTCVRLHTIAW
jgi:hypothetical protein